MYDYESLTFGTIEADIPTIVMLHEGLGSVSMWRDFPALLHSITALPVFVYSRRGYGNSEPAELPRNIQFMHEESEVLKEILKQNQIHFPILFGHSDGASIALIYAGSDAGIKARLLILEAPHVFAEELTIRSISEARNNYETGTLRSKLEKYHRDVDHTFLSWTDIWLQPEFPHWNIEEYLPQITIPVLIIQGEDDQYGTLRQVQSIQKLCRGPVETLILPGCKHSPHRDKPDDVLNATAEFLKNRMKV